MPDIVLEKATSLQTLEYHRSDITTCDFDENFRLASGSSDKTVMIWEWQTGVGYVEVPYAPISEYKYGVSNVIFIAKESILATSSYDGSLSLWNTQNGTLLHSFMHANLIGIRCTCFISENNYLISAGDDGTLCIWDINRRILVKTLQAHEETITVVCASFDGKIVLTGDTNGLVKIFHMSVLSDTDISARAKLPLPIHTELDCHDLGINHANFSRSTSISENGVIYILATCGNDNVIKLWELTLKKNAELLFCCSLKLLTTFSGHSSAVTNVKFSPIGDLLASTSMDKTTRLWKIRDDFRCIKVLNGHTRYVTTCSFSPDGTMLATGSNDKLLIVWDLTGVLSLKSQLLTDSLWRNNVSTIKISSLVNKNTSKIFQKIDNLGNAINSCCFSKNDLLAAGGTDKLLRLWHPSSNNRNKFVELSVSPLVGHRYAINQVDFSLCGTMLASCSVDGTTILWDMTEYKQKCTFFGTEGGIKTCRFSPNSQLLATGGDSEVVAVYSLNNQQCLANMTGHTDTITCLSFTHDSKYLASGCASGHFRLWSVNPCITICMLFVENVHDLGVVSNDFSLIGSNDKNKYLFATCGNDSLVKLWYIFIMDEIRAKCNLVHQLCGHGGDVTCVRFPRNSIDILASSATDKTIRIWDTNSGTCLSVLDSKDMMLACCSFSPDSSLLASGGLDKAIIIWSLRNSEDEFETFALNRLVTGSHVVETGGNSIENEDLVNGTD